MSIQSIGRDVCGEHHLRRGVEKQLTEWDVSKDNVKLRVMRTVRNLVQISIPSRIGAVCIILCQS